MTWLRRINIYKSTQGHAIDERGNNWVVECPYCGYETEYEGYFDDEDIYDCNFCKNKYKITRVWINDNIYI